MPSCRTDRQALAQETDPVRELPIETIWKVDQGKIAKVRTVK